MLDIVPVPHQRRAHSLPTIICISHPTSRHDCCPTTTVIFVRALTESVYVLTGDGRVLIGTLVGHDQVQNLILTDAHERVYTSETEECEIVPLGLYMVRGDSLCLIGEYDQEELADRANPIGAIQQQQL